MESLCPRLVSLHLQIPSRFWINERMNQRPFTYNMWIIYIIGTFIIFSPCNIDNISVIQKFIIHASKMRKQKPMEVEELSQNYTTTRYQKLVWVCHSVLKGPVFINISKVFQQTEIKAYWFSPHTQQMGMAFYTFIQFIVKARYGCLLAYTEGTVTFR